MSSPLLDISNSTKDNKDNRNSFSGKLDKKLGVGPLNELFDYGLRNFLSDRKLKTKELKRLKVDAKKFDVQTNAKPETAIVVLAGTGFKADESVGVAPKCRGVGVTDEQSAGLQ